jgi:hypothetical protein
VLDNHVWGMKITALKESADFDTLETGKLFSKLKSHELFRKGRPNHDSSLTSKALITSARVQIYVDDIIFIGSSNTLVSRFQEMMENEFQMCMMGELIFFLGIQVKQTKQGTFVHQAKYTKDLMKTFNMDELKPMSTPMSMATSLDPDENGEAID